MLGWHNLRGDIARVNLKPTHTPEVEIVLTLSPTSPSTPPREDKTAGLDMMENIPIGYALLECSPNPIFPNMTVRYALPTTSLVTLKLYGMLGGEIQTLVREQKGPGFHTAGWDGSDKLGVSVTKEELILRIEAEATDGSQVFISARKLDFNEQRAKPRRC